MAGQQIVDRVVGIAVGLIVVASIVPVALVTLANATFYTVDPAVVTIVTVLLPILAVISIAIYFLRD